MYEEMEGPGPAPVIQWLVPVISGPSSPDNLVTTMVAWARHAGRNPHAFQLTMENDGKTLLLRGFDAPSLRDFLRYAEYSSIPALECGPPRPYTPPSRARAPTAPTAAEPSPPESPHTHPPTLSSQSIQMVMGTAQLLADRATNVRDAEHWVAGTLGIPEVKAEHVGLLLRLLSDPSLNTLRLSLAGSPVLRQEGATLLKVAPELIPDVLDLWLQPGPPSGSPPPGIPPRPADRETLLRAQVYAKGLLSQAEHWKDVAGRLKVAKAQGQPEVTSLLEGAVFVNEEEGKVSWVVPSGTSPVVKALSGYITECHRLLRAELDDKAEREGSWVSAERRETFAALETARRATQMALRLGVEFRWVVLLSTSFDEGKEETFGLPVGKASPWSAQTPPAPALAASTAPGRPGGVVRKLPPAAAVPTVIGFTRFAAPLEAPLDPWLEQQGISTAMLRGRRAVAKPAAAPPPAGPGATPSPPKSTVKPRSAPSSPSG